MLCQRLSTQSVRSLKSSLNCFKFENQSYDLFFEKAISQPCPNRVCTYMTYPRSTVDCVRHLAVKAPVPLGRIFFLVVRDRDKFSNREHSETNRNNENVMCDYLSEYLRMCFRLYKDSSRPFLNILRTLKERSKIAEDQ